MLLLKMALEGEMWNQKLFLYRHIHKGQLDYHLLVAVIGQDTHCYIHNELHLI
jgi:hypothetical protein